MVSFGLRTTARAITLSNSRMFPGHGYRVRASRRGAERHAGSFRISRMSVQEKLGQGRDIPWSFAERRQGQGHDVQSEIEIFAELPGLDRLPKVLVRGRDDPDVHRDGLVPPTR